MAENHHQGRQDYWGMLLHGRGKEMQCLRVELARRGINIPLISSNVLVFIRISENHFKHTSNLQTAIMKLSFIAALAVLGTAVAVPAGPATQVSPISPSSAA